MAFELINSYTVPVLQSVCSILQLPSFVSYATFLEILFNHAEVQEGNHDFYMNQLLKYISHKVSDFKFALCEMYFSAYCIIEGDSTVCGMYSDRKS